MSSETYTNNIRRFEAIGERDLQAYVDGQLDDKRARAVETYLSRHREAAEQVHADLACNRMLRDAVPVYEEAEIPPRLMAALNRPERPVLRTMTKTAAVIALCIASAAGGWQAGVTTDKGITASQEKLAQSGNQEVTQPDSNPPVHTSVPLNPGQQSGHKQANIANNGGTRSDTTSDSQEGADMIYPQQVIPDKEIAPTAEIKPRIQQQ